MTNHYLTGREVKQIRQLRKDGYTHREIVETTGRSLTTVQRIVPGRIGRAPIAPLREAFLRSGYTVGEVARKLGWLNKSNNAPDTSRLKRNLGIVCDATRYGRRIRIMSDIERITQIAEAIGVDPWEVLPEEIE